MWRMRGWTGWIAALSLIGAIGVRADAPGDLLAEARRLYDVNRAQAWEKLAAAQALAPDSLACRVLQEDWTFYELPRDANLAEFLPLLESMLATDRERGDLTRILWRMRQGSLLEAWQRASSAEQERLADFCTRYRDLYDESCRRELRLDRPLATISDLEQREVYYEQMPEFTLYFSLGAYSAARVAGAMEFLRLSEAFFRDHPEGPFKTPPEEWIPYHLNLRWAMFGEEELGAELTAEYDPDAILAYADLAQQHPLRSVRGLGLLIELYCRARMHGYDEAEFRTDVRNFARRFAELDLKPEGGLANYRWRFVLRRHPKLIAIADEETRTLLPEWSGSDGECFVEELLKVKDRNQVPAFLLAHRDECIRYAAELRRVPIGDCCLGSIGGILQELIWEHHVPRGLEALEIFNRDMEITQIVPTQSDFTYFDGIARNGELLMVAVNFPADILRVEALNLATFERRVLYELPTKFDMCVYGFRNVIDSFSFPSACDDKVLAVAAEGAIHVFQLDGSGVRTLSDLPEREINAVAILDGRIYAWGGFHQNGHSSGQMFFSCDLDGGGQEIIFRERSGTAFPLLRGLAADPARHRLILLGVEDGLYAYDPVTKKLELVLSPQKAGCCSRSQHDDIAMQQITPGQLLFSQGGDFMIYDLATDRYELYLCGSLAKRKHGKYRYDGDWSLNGLFLPMDGYVWINAFGDSICLRLREDGTTEKLFWYPPFEETSHNRISRFFPAADGRSAVEIRGSDVLKLTPRR